MISDAELDALLERMSDEEIDQALQQARSIDRDAPLAYHDLDVWTRDEPPRLAPLVLNPVQALLSADLCRAYGVPHLWQARGMRVNVLKSRQQGMSTLWLAVWYMGLYNLDYSQTVIITHRTESTAMLWQRVQLWEQRIRKGGRKRLARLKYSNRRELVREDSGSSLFIGTAGQDDLTRSGTITSVHFSETAFWDADTGAIMAATLGTLPAWANIVEESTASGYGEHKDRYELQDAPGGIARTYFFPFSDTPEYTLSPPADFQRSDKEATLTAVRHLAGTVERLPLTDGQVYWRRQRATEFRLAGTPALVGQEFPLSPKEAFLASATGAVFDVEYLEALSDEMRGLVPDQVVEEGHAGIGGTLTIYEQPEEGEVYIVPADPAGGHNEDDEHDYSFSHVLRLRDRMEVAFYVGRPAPERFAEDLAYIAQHYNRALIIPEREQMGFEVISELAHMSGVSLYLHDPTPEDPSRPKPPEHTRRGMPASTTKTIGDGMLQSQIALAAEIWRSGSGQYTPSEAALYVGCPVFRDPRTISELIHYSNLPNRKRGGKGSHDDAVSSARMGNYYCEMYAPQGRKPPKPAERQGGYARSVVRREPR